MASVAGRLIILFAGVGLAGWGALYLTRDVTPADEPPATAPEVAHDTGSDSPGITPATEPLLPPLTARARELPPPPRALARRPVPAARQRLAVRPPIGTFPTQPRPAAATIPVEAIADVAEDEMHDDEPFVPLDIARAALELVGADPDAELVWEAAINDPALSPEDRSDLIEDLNEVGIDPRNLTPADLPLIVSRLALIEELAPDAMDQTNFDAFAEAYKDLVNMYLTLTRGQ